MTPWEYIEAARCPPSLKPQSFGLWNIQRIQAAGMPCSTTEMAMHRGMVGFDDYTLLRRITWETIDTMGEIVMEDSARELKKHLPIWMKARGRVLVTGLGLGCVVRGLLANRDVDRIEVVEIDKKIARVLGAEFVGNPRVGMTVGDAMETDFPGTFDFAWHDLWAEKAAELQMMHAKLIHQWKPRCGPQGAWAFPRFMAELFRRRSGYQLLGGPR